MNKPKLKILQLAAYGSNIGDNANISGIRKTLTDNLCKFDLQFEDWDIVDFSWNLRDFDDSTISHINSFDLFIIGGGGFLEIIPGSTTWTGTRINIPKEIFERITVLTVFYSLGIDMVRAELDGRDVSTEKEKFRSFVDFIRSRPNYLLSTRHDGSTDVLNNILGEEVASAFSLVPDGGFFSTFGDFYHPELSEGKINIVINFGGDLLEARFRPSYDVEVNRNNPLKLKRPSDYEDHQYMGHKGYTQFLISFSNVMRQLAYESSDIQFILVPHIYRDIEVSYHLLSEIGFPYCRRQVFMAPYIQGFAAKDYIVDLYKKCSLSIGMRFHANVCPIGLGTPSVGLVTFPMINSLYDSLNIGDRKLNVGAGKKFEEDLYKLISNSLSNKNAITGKYQLIKQELAALNAEFHKKIERYLDARTI